MLYKLRFLFHLKKFARKGSAMHSLTARKNKKHFTLQPTLRIEGI